MATKINQVDLQKPVKARRSFLKSMGLLFTGSGMFRPSFLFQKTETVDRGGPHAPNAESIINLQDAAPLPDGVKPVWDLAKAYRETTATREKICINGLWMWQPGTLNDGQLPTGTWGYFKAPGPWPANIEGRNENQYLFAHPAWKDIPLQDLKTSWYQRQINIPKDWRGRRLALLIEYLYSNAEIFIDGRKAGELWFPSGELDVSPFCKAGGTHLVTMKVSARPLKDVITAYSDSNMARQVEGTVARRGLCGDLYLLSTPAAARIAHVGIETSVRRSEIAINVDLLDLEPQKKYKLRAVITDGDKKVAEFTGEPFAGDNLPGKRKTLTSAWKPEKLWDIHTPHHIYQAGVSLVDAAGTLVDEAVATRFGFRDFRIDGRDFYLNGSRIWLSCVPLDNGQSGVAMASYEEARESLLRLKSTGINFVYTHNYGCEPGSHLSFAEILRAADDAGILVALSQPHFSHYEWGQPDADLTNGYAHHASFYTRVAGNHPSVVFYSTSHNATGYAQDMNPEMIDGVSRADSQWSQNNVEKALRAETIIRKLDPNRVVYHHSSGNLGAMYTCNFYANWVPVQEMNEWFGHWSEASKKPAMLVEFSTPFTWDYGMYRGWYKGVREFGGAKVPWEFCLAEWNAQFIGDKAYAISEYEKANLRWESERFRAGDVWGRSDYPYPFDSVLLEERNEVFAKHFAANWRAFRTWGVSAVNAMWHYTLYWRLREGVRKGPRVFKTDWDNLQRPGLSPDIVHEQRERMDMGYERADWEPTVAAKAIMDNHGALTAYLAGKPDAFTDKSHILHPGQRLEKQLVVINNSRENIECECTWSLNLPQKVNGRKFIKLSTGNQERVALAFDLPANVASGEYELRADFMFSNGKTFTDSLFIDILPTLARDKFNANVAVFDPRGETSQLLKDLGIDYTSVDHEYNPEGTDLLIIGKGALSLDGAAPDVSSVRKGLRVIVFEQAAPVLEQRFGFRVQAYGLRQVYKRVPDHPVLKGLGQEHFHDWNGSATLLPPRREGGPEFKWCDLPVTRVWRCGNRGSVASVLIEKPVCGNFLPLLDGGYSLQYSPLMEYREGKGMVIFCQVDVTGRTEVDPAAERLAANILSYARDWKPTVNREAVYLGDPMGRRHLQRSTISVSDNEGERLGRNHVMIAGPGSGKQLSSNGIAIRKWLQTGGHMVAIGLDQADISGIFPYVSIKNSEHIASSFEPYGMASLLAGISPADVHNRAPREIPLVASGAQIVGNGMLAKLQDANVVFNQLIPWELDYSREQHNVKQTFRRWSFLLNRLLGNMGVSNACPILERFGQPVNAAKNEKRWLTGLYLDDPEEWDDPYRFFRW